MHPSAPLTERTEPPAPQPVSPGDRPLPPCIAFLLDIVRNLLIYGRRLDEILPQQATHPRFPTFAAGFGTHDVRRILTHIQRGILRAMMLERFLLARAAQDRDIEPISQPTSAEPAEIEALELKLRARPQPSLQATPGKPPRPAIDPDDPMHLSIPTLKQLEAEIRRRSVGRTIADICLDFGLAGSTCDGAFWDDILLSLTHFAGNFDRFFETQTHRRESFQKERDKLPDTWDCDWRDRPREAIREVVGFPAGEPPPNRLIAPQ